MTIRLVAFTFLGIALTGALWLAFKPQNGSSGTLSPTVGAVPVGGRESSTPVQEVFEIEVKAGRVVSGSAVLQAHEGDEITIKIVSDRSDEVHLHGYDLHGEIEPGETTVLAFKATRTGRFGLEMHRSHIEAGTLEVYPQ